MSAYDQWLSSDYDDDKRSEAIDMEAEAIGSNPDLRWEAVSCGDDDDLTELRLALADSAWLLGKMAEGLTLDEILALKPTCHRVIDDFRDLLRKAEACNQLVESRVAAAAADAVDTRH